MPAMRRWFAISIASFAVTAGAHAATPPLPRVVETGLAADLADVATMPSSGAHGDPARVNYLFYAGDGSGRLFIDDMRGRIDIIKGGKLLTRPFLDVAAVPGFKVGGSVGSEVGLLTFAFHPDYARKGTPGYGKFYTLNSQDAGADTPPGAVTFTGPKPQPHHYNVLSEWTVDPADPDRIDPASRREILRLVAHADDHGGGQLGFDPNAKPGAPDYGLLYISVGDGGNTVWDHGKVEKYHLAQDMNSAFGKILRINPLRAGNRSYSVPATNPFVACQECVAGNLGQRVAQSRALQLGSRRRPEDADRRYRPDNGGGNQSGPGRRQLWLGASGMKAIS